MRLLITIWFVLLGWTCLAQPTFNSWYDLNRDQTAFHSVISTDSCYYIAGSAKNETIPSYWDLAFIKLDLNGDIVSESYVTSDSASINCANSRMLESYEGEFAVLSTYNQYFLFTLFAEDGAIIDSVVIDSFITHHQLWAVQPTEIVQNENDSSYTILALVQDTATYKGKMCLFELDKNLNMNYFKVFWTEEPEYIAFYTSSLLKQSDGYLLSGTMVKVTSIDEEQRAHITLIKTDFDGNEVWRWVDWNNLLDNSPLSLTQTIDGGYLFGGSHGEYVAPPYTNLYEGKITKLDSNLNEEWQIHIGDSTDWLAINCSGIEKKSEFRYVANGYLFADTMIVGWMIEFDLQGQVIWDSYFSYVPFQEGFGTSTFPDHYLFDITRTADGGFINVGAANDVYLNMQGQNSFFAWAFKTDSVGCLVPGCQDFLGDQPLKHDEPIFEIYPNPVSDQLYIYFNESNYKKGQTAQIIDLQGRVIHTFNLHSNDMTYIIDVSSFESGVYYCVIDFTESKVSKKFVVNN